MSKFQLYVHNKSKSYGNTPDHKNINGNFNLQNFDFPSPFKQNSGSVNTNISLFGNKNRKSSSNLPKADLFLTDFIQMQKLKTIQMFKENQMELIENSIMNKRPHANSVSFNFNPIMSPEIKFKSNVFNRNVNKDKEDHVIHFNTDFNDEVYVSCNKN